MSRPGWLPSTPLQQKLRREREEREALRRDWERRQVQKAAQALQIAPQPAQTEPQPTKPRIKAKTPQR
jgi:hypothetical protein